MLGSMAIWGLLLTPLHLPAAAEDATSVIVNIQRSATEVSSQVHQDLTRRISDMSRRWEANLEKALALYEQARKDGQPARVAQFEEQISKTMQDTAQDLAAILTQQEPATAGLDRLTTALAEGMTFFGSQGSQVQAEITHINEGQKKLETQLQDLAQRYRQAILKGQLPPDVDAAVRELEMQRRTAEFRAQVKQKTAEVAAAQVRAMEKYVTYVQHLRGFSREAFTQARGQILVLGDLAELRQLGVSMAQISDRVAEFGKATVTFSATVQQGEPILQRLIDLPLPAGFGVSEEVPVVEVKSGQGLDILKRYLDTGRQAQRP
jgi:chromosome segregation ATPase